MTSNNNKPLLIDPYGEEEEHLPLRTPSITVDELKLTEDEQAHLADIPVHSTPQYQEEFSTIAWDQEEIRERQNRDEIYRKVTIYLYIYYMIERHYWKITTWMLCVPGLVGSVLCRFCSCCVFCLD